MRNQQITRGRIVLRISDLKGMARIPKANPTKLLVFGVIFERADLNLIIGILRSNQTKSNT